MSIALCPECGGEGSHEVSRPQPDDPYFAVSEQCRHCGGVGHVEEDGPTTESPTIGECDCCGRFNGLERCWLGEMETFACKGCRP